MATAVRVEGSSLEEPLEDGLVAVYQEYRDAIREAGGVTKGELISQAAAAYAGTDGPLDDPAFREKDRGRGRWWSP